MLKLVLSSAIIIAVCFALLAINIIIKKNGRFPNTHVGNSKAMKERGIGCNVSQDREARQENKHKIKEY